MKEKVDRNITYYEVLTKDLTSYLFGLFYLFYLSLLVVITISIYLFDADPPKESTWEIAIGSVIITSIFYLLLKFRISKISKMLRNGERINADIIKGLSYQFFVHISIKYLIGNKNVGKKLLLPNTRSCRALITRHDLTVVLFRDKINNVVVHDLYN